MYVQSLIAIFSLLMSSYFQETSATTPLPEEDPANFGDQDVTKMVEVAEKHWVKRRTHNVSSRHGDPKCEYAEIFGSADEKQKEEEKKYTLVLEAKFGEMWIASIQVLGLTKSGTHSQPNVMRFVRDRVDGPQGHKLLYSNYKNCSILRIKKKEEGLFCDLLLLGSAASSEPPSPCKEKFEKYCKGDQIEVYTYDCGTEEK
ncbi:uncharacterized protein LOC120842565 [Ixodes scapularis]|uniref:uncharacterized protein LOC120842565 n=1 Tax=Ixodes scapularis TaxID=6945 RepID=UPI001A9DCBAC|nr:uncharacterized protein LOC120842565 [Ixodes scapularis]